MRHSIAVLSAFLVALPARAAEAPNVVLVMADDQGWGDMAYNGHPHLKTPHFDALAREGVRFDRFYAAAPVCSPTRGSVLTGRHPNRFGCFKWGYPLRPPARPTRVRAVSTSGRPPRIFSTSTRCSASGAGPRRSGATAPTSPPT